jgi:eukaryotic-like serine/threonine-protein kinase
VEDFINQTGDPVFEATLNQALVVQLRQSPVLDIVSQRHLHQSLQYLGKKPDTLFTPEIADADLAVTAAAKKEYAGL